MVDLTRAPSPSLLLQRWPARDWTSQISYEAVASVVRELNVFEALTVIIISPFAGQSDVLKDFCYHHEFEVEVVMLLVLVC